jgi:hypothetical protein
MSEPKPTWIEMTEQLAEQHAGLMTRLNDHGRKATRQEALMAQLTAEPVDDAVKAVQAVARLETEPGVGTPIVGAWSEPIGEQAGQG